MQTRYEKTVTILPSRVDAGGRLSVPDTFDLFMDTATEAARALGVGWDFLIRRGMFWITVKTKIKFIRRPGLLETVTVETWPEVPGERRCIRHYKIVENGEVLALGKTDWAIVSVRDGRPQAMADIMPEGLDYPDEKACPEPFPLIDEAFSGAPCAEHRVLNTDIDMARHMNNVAYVQAIVNTFPVARWEAMDVREMDIIFRASAHEGDVLRFQSRRDGGLLEIRGSLPDGSTSVLARLRLGEDADGEGRSCPGT